MAKNDKLLLDQIISEIAISQDRPDGDVFQSFAIGEILKDYDLAPDEFDLGIVDGRDDGGIDAWYTFLDGELLSDVDDATPRRGSNQIDVFIFTAKHHDTFKQEPVVHLYATALDLLDLTKSDDDLSSRYNDDLLACRSIFKSCLIKTARGTPHLNLAFCYLSRGDSDKVGESIRARSDALVAECSTLFSDCTVTFNYYGAKELLAASRKLKDFSAILTFEEGPVSRGGTDYVGLARIANYYRFVVDSDGKLRRYLFESNVRDYVGRTSVNKSIMQTLRTRVSSEVEDFWWLNNGVTIIANRAKVIGKDLHLDNVQIVNGLQTTESVYKYFQQSGPVEDSRCILVKVLVTSQKALADRIILATNNQNKVDFASLHATDKIQRDIEDVLEAGGWYYDRRKNFYLNQGKPSARIVSMTFMSWVVMAALLGRPSQCGARWRYLRSGGLYHAIFSEQYDLQMYRAALEFCRAIESSMVSMDFHVQPYEARSYTKIYRFLYVHLYALLWCGRYVRTDKDVVELAARPVDPSRLQCVHDCVLSVRKAMRDGGESVRRLHRSKAFQTRVSALVASSRAGQQVGQPGPGSQRPLPQWKS